MIDSMEKSRIPISRDDNIVNDIHKLSLTENKISCISY